MHAEIDVFSAVNCHKYYVFHIRLHRGLVYSPQELEIFAIAGDVQMKKNCIFVVLEKILKNLFLSFKFFDFIIVKRIILGISFALGKRVAEPKQEH